MEDKEEGANYLRDFTPEDADGNPILDVFGKPAKPYAPLITQTVNANTLSKAARDLAKQGKQFPSTYKDEQGNERPLFKTGTRDSTGWRKIEAKS